MESIVKFGKLPAGESLEKIRKSPNYRNGSFQNLKHTPDLSEGAGYYTVFKELLFGERKRVKPVDDIPSVKVDLLHLSADQNVLVWFGHSSYFMQVDGKAILVDPVLSGAASPVAATTRAFKGTDRYSADDLPAIDYLFISHDHWDHLDYSTIIRLKSRIGKVICGLGIGAHFEHWGFDTSKIIERDWYEQIVLDKGFIAHTAPARHFSGRGLTRNKALWTSFALQTPTMNIYLGGDSGYDNHFAEIGEKYGPFDLAILENGQYDKNWKYIHMMPEQVLQAANDLSAKWLFPVHSSKFSLANHAWDEPLKKITSLNEGQALPLLTPMIGELIDLSDPTRVFPKWWEGVE